MGNSVCRMRITGLTVYRYQYLDVNIKCINFDLNIFYKFNIFTSAFIKIFSLHCYPHFKSFHTNLLNPAANLIRIWSRNKPDSFHLLRAPVKIIPDPGNLKRARFGNRGVKRGLDSGSGFAKLAMKNKNGVSIRRKYQLPVLEYIFYLKPLVSETRESA
jgi:hypothetical protein